VFPYLIGLSENAIQYLQESETDKRFHEGDQGVFAFRRYRHHLLEPVIWTDDLAYDHSSRDLAEFIRYKFLEEELDMREISSFLKDYQEIRPLSVFSWRLLYARLVYPIHFFDFIETGFNNNDERKHLELKQFLRKQEIYEERLGNLFESVNVDYKRYDLPVIKWFA
jgi:spore coat protein YutH